MTTAHLHKTSVRAACSDCGAKPFELCVDAGGDPIERSHPARVAAARAVPQVTEEQLDGLDAIVANPAAALHPTVRNTLRARGWIRAIDPPVPPNHTGRYRRMPARRHQVTAEGHAIRVGTGRCCADLVAFTDGELDEAAAAAFRAHLPGCDRCRVELVDQVDVAARLSTLAPEQP